MLLPSGGVLIQRKLRVLESPPVTDRNLEGIASLLAVPTILARRLPSMKCSSVGLDGQRKECLAHRKYSVSKRMIVTATMNSQIAASCRFRFLTDDHCGACF